jgi:hypothetical protein
MGCETDARANVDVLTHLQRVPKHEPGVLHRRCHQLLSLVAAFERTPLHFIDRALAGNA